MNDMAGYVASVLSGLAVSIPLVIKLVEYVKKSIQEKNWSSLVSLVIKLMQEAESKFDSGAQRKEWVVAMVIVSAEAIHYKIDVEEVGKMIDDLCDMSKIVNGPLSEKKSDCV